MKSKKKFVTHLKLNAGAGVEVRAFSPNLHILLANSVTQHFVIIQSRRRPSRFLAQLQLLFAKRIPINIVLEIAVVTVQFLGLFGEFSNLTMSALCK